MNNILPLATKRITVEDLALREVSQTQADKHHVSSHSFVLSWPPDRNVPLSSTFIFLLIMSNDSSSQKCPRVSHARSS